MSRLPQGKAKRLAQPSILFIFTIGWFIAGRDASLQTAQQGHQWLVGDCWVRCPPLLRLFSFGFQGFFPPC